MFDALRGPITVRRRAAGSWVDGQWVEGSESSITIQASVQPARQDDMDMLLIAAVNEFGSADGRVPERSYIRAGFDKNRSKLRNTAAALWGRVLDGDMDQRQALGLLGETHQDQVQKFLTALSAPPNAASTIARKRGSANPLIDTGRLRSSIRWVHDD